MLGSIPAAKKFYSTLGTVGLCNLATSHYTRALIKTVEPLCPKNGHILDLACGYGRITLPLARKGYSIEGIDITPVLIADAKKKAKAEKLSVTFRVGDMQKLPYKEDYFDTIICLWSSFNHLLHKKEQRKALKEIYRVLRPCGVAFIEMLNGEQKLMKERLKKEGAGPDHRWWREGVRGLEDSDYTHDRATLTMLCKSIGLRYFRVGFKNIGGQRRLVLYIYKK